VRHSTGVSHTRSIRRAQDGRSLSCTDRLVDAGNTPILGSVRFPLAPNAVIKLDGDAAEILVDNMVLELSWNEASSWLEPIEIAPAYGSTLSSQMLVLRGSTVTWTLCMR